LPIITAFSLLCAKGLTTDECLVDFMAISTPPQLPFSPSRILQLDEGYLAIGQDGQLLQLDQNLSYSDNPVNPFPISIEQACIVGNNLVATWLDAELMLARMASIDLNNKLVEGPSKADLRVQKSLKTALHPAGNTWSRVLDSQPLALASDGKRIAFVLWNKGIYCLNEDSSEIWRSPYPVWEMVSKLPRSDETICMSFNDSEIHIWCAAGGRLVLNADDGTVVRSEKVDIDAVVENIFHNELHELVCSNNGEAFHLVDTVLRMQTDITGPIQYAAWDSDSNTWRICGWRKEVLLLDRPTTCDHSEIPIHCLKVEGEWWNLFNDGNWKLSNL
jgi:hypothetical protein